MINVKNFKDLISSKNWSPEYHLNKDNGKKMYIKKNQEFIEIDIKKSIPKDVFYLTDEQVKEYNKISKEIKKLKDEQEKIIS